MTYRKHINLALVLAAILAFSGCEAARMASEARRDAQSLSWVRTANPQRDATQAIARGDYRFYAVNGIAPGIIPGIDQWGVHRALAEAHGYRIIGGTSDYSNGDLNELAMRYATTYNKVLLRHFHAKPRNA